ncbi:MAG: ABC transporter permease [Bryobacteraceae bacterium]
MFRYFPLAFKNTLRNRRRTALTISSIAVSLCLLGVLIAIYHALYYQQATPGQALRLIVRHKVSLAQAFPSAYEAKIRRIPGVKAVSAWNWYGGTYKNQQPVNFFARFGVDPVPFFKLRTQMTMPEDERQAFIRERTACIVSKDLADRLHFHLGQRITLKGDIYPGKLQLIVRGIFEDPDARDSLFFNMEYLRQLLPLGRRNMDSTVAVLVDSPQDAPRVAKAIDATFANADPPTKTQSEQQFTLSFVSFLGNIKLFLLSICAAVTFTILLVSGNTMAMSVRERIKEVGVLKTLGFTNGGVLSIIIGEAVAIAIIGGIVGLLFAEVLTAIVGKVAEGFMPELHGLTVQPATALIALGLAAFIGLVSSFLPAWNAARTNIIDSLRYSG